MNSANSGPKSSGEAALWSYLQLRKLPFDYEPFTDGANPDFLVEHPICGRVVMDVYGPRYHLPRYPDGSFLAGPIAGPEVTLRKAFKDQRKARQAQVAVDASSPFILVFARTHSELDFESHHVAGALFGTFQVVFPLDEEPDDARVRMVFGQGGRLQPARNTRFAAVAVISGFNPRMKRVERIAEARFSSGMTPSQRAATLLEVSREEADAGRYREGERVFWLKVFHNPFAAIPLSCEFAGPHDDQWLASYADGTYLESAWGILGHELPGRGPVRL